MKFTESQNSLENTLKHCNNKNGVWTTEMDMLKFEE